MTIYDPIASLAPFAIHVTLGGQEYEIPALPAIDWLRVLIPEDISVLDVVPGLFPDDVRVLVEERIMSRSISREELLKAAFDVITVASGRDYWFTVKFLAVCRVSWDAVGGVLARSGIDARTIPLAAWIDAAYHIAREIIASGKDGSQNLVRFTSELEAPPPGIDYEIDEELEAAAFERAVRMAQH